jgi:hypothetical protein
MGREAEEPAQELFEKYLIEDQEVVDSSRNRGETPDRILHCGKNSYAVEITSLIESIPIGDSQAHSLQMSKAVHTNIALKVEKVAKEKGILRGTYSLVFGRSLLNKPDLEEIATTFVLNYIGRTMMDEKAPPEILPSPDSIRSVAFIVKHCSDGAKLNDANPTASGWEGDCRSEFQRIITDRVECKIEKLAACEFPIVLLLWAATSLISYKQLREVEISQSCQDSAAAAYLVSQDWGVFQLWSSISNWDG